MSPDGCACEYIESLAPGGKFEAYRDRAVRMFKTPHQYRHDCPCPSCYMDRRWQWFEGQRPKQLRREA